MRAALLLVCAFAALPVRAAEVFVAFGTSMKYLSNAGDPGVGDAWTAAGFDDAAWSNGLYGIGFDEQGDATALIPTRVPAGTRSVFTRAYFDVANPAAVTSLFLGADYDDGFAAWINGIEVYRSPELPGGPLGWNTPAADRESSNAAAPNYLPVHNISTAGLGALQAGANVLAIAVWNATPTSTDLVLVPELSANRAVQTMRDAYLQLATPTSMTVRWRTDVATTSRVRFGRTPGQLTQNVTQFEEVSEHEIELTGLLPYTVYYYTYGTADAVLGGGPQYRFRTPPLPGTDRATRIWVLGDSGTGLPGQLAVRDAYYNWAAGTTTDLWLMLGDNAYEDGTDVEFQQKLFDVYPEMLRRAPLFPALGNHDGVAADSATQSGPYYDIFSLPRNAEAGGVSSGTEAYYSFDYANIHFIVLDSHETPRAPTGAMLQWLEEDIADTTQDWVIAYWHHPPYSKGLHDSDLELNQIEMRENVVPILEDYGVDLVLGGHSHSYERSYLIDGHYGDSTTFSDALKVDGGDGRMGGSGPYIKPYVGPEPHHGAVYTVAGTAGWLGGGDLDHPAMFLSLNLLGSMVLDVSGNRLDARFLSHEGQVLDEFTILKGIVPPTAALSANPVAGPAPLAVAFTDTSAGAPTSWAWDVDGSGTIDSLQPNPAWIYPSPGVYTVGLAVSNLAGSDEHVAPDLICVYQGPPAPITDLAFPNGSKSDFAWSPRPDASGYDVVRGNLAPLRSSRGNFAAAPLACLGNNTPNAWAVDPGVPGPRQAFFYLVRATNCAVQTGTYDSMGPGQVGSRDREVQVSAGSCACDPADDRDGDGLCYLYDNCPTVHNPNQYDTDGDGAGEPCDDCTDTDGDGWGNPGYPVNLCPVDNCPNLFNNQADRDNDDVGDMCDVCPDDPLDDADGDTICGSADNCPAVANPNQADTDGDGVGDLCDVCSTGAANDPDNDGVCTDSDNCAYVPNVDQADADEDGVGDVCDPCTDLDADGWGNPGFPASICPPDNCPEIANPLQTDWDFDGLGNLCDPCPNDFENDGDADGHCADLDNCPESSNPGQDDLDSDGEGDACDRCTDGDDDGYGDPGFPANTCPLDNCPALSNPAQSDADADGRGDPCDPCPADPTNDVDGDGRCGAVDNCPAAPNPDQADADADGLGNACDACTDTDGDGFGSPGWPLNTCPPDNCPSHANVDQADGDGDGSGDVCDTCTDGDGDGFGDPGLPGSCATDNCPTVPNPQQVDADGDGAGDACDGCPLDAQDDTDGDGVCGNVDNCPVTPNAAQDDGDGDGAGDPCDPCTDSDGDGFGDPGYAFIQCALDNCPGVPNPQQLDADADGAGDACDSCPLDAQDDADGDGVCGNVDNCPATPNAAQDDGDGDGAGDLCDPCTDSDGDGFGDPGRPNPACAVDNCPNSPNPSQGDLDGDGIGNICDPCSDSDGDGFGNPGPPNFDCALDNCPAIANPSQADLDGDGQGDACDTCTDYDGDGFGSPGFPLNQCATDNCPGVPNPDQFDSDHDGRGDTCDSCTDTDGDGFGDPGYPFIQCAVDNCPATANPEQGDADSDGAGDACDPCTDTDGDGYGNPGFGSNQCATDNCPTTANPGQGNADADGSGDACDSCTDTDGDGFGNPGYPGNQCAADNCPTTANPAQGDADADGVGNVCDPCTDTDGDGYGNPGFGSNQCATDNCPTTANASQSNADGDGPGDACDTCTDTDGDGYGNPGYGFNQCPTDNCPTTANASQSNADGDGPGDACDTCTDTDGDGFGNPGFTANQCVADNCPAVPNVSQTDTDGDGQGDVCDTCTDSDGDGAGDPGYASNQCVTDNCPATSNPGQADADADGAGDVCDTCTDTDGDGFGDPGYASNQCAADNCPAIPNVNQTDTDGDGQGNACDTCTDSDGDGAGDPGYASNQCVTDNCPATSNPGQADADGDGFGDVCDTCTDTDGDGFGDPGYAFNQCAIDNCPATPNANQADTDSDGQGDDCDSCTDYDGDGFGSPGFPLNQCATDNCPGVPNPDQLDGDGDGRGDTCDPCPADPSPDSDGDRVCDSTDNCPVQPNADQSDADLDGHGDLCDVCPDDPFDDADGDSVCASIDNCPTLSNALQQDDDGDGIGNACAFVPVDEGTFWIAATEVTNEQYVVFLNAVAATDPNGLFNPLMAADPRGGIARSGADGEYVYFTRPDMERKPVNFASWSDAARYVNWWANGQPSGAQDTGTTETGTYDMTQPNAGSTALRAPGAAWFLPTTAEWELGAYDDPHVGTTWTYPTRSDAIPTPALADAAGALTNPGRNVANYGNGAVWGGQTGHLTNVAGAGPLATSAAGTYDQAGNVAEWAETPAPGNKRMAAGGAYDADAAALQAGSAAALAADEERSDVGFRVASAVAKGLRPPTRPE